MKKIQKKLIHVFCLLAKLKMNLSLVLAIFCCSNIALVVTDDCSNGFAVAPGVLFSSGNDRYDPQREYSPQLSQIYNEYLNRLTGDFSDLCLNDENRCESTGQPVVVEESEFAEAIRRVEPQIEAYQNDNTDYLGSDPRGLVFSTHITNATVQAKYNELLTEQLKHSKCLTRKQIALDLSKNVIPPNPYHEKEYCDLEDPNASIDCDFSSSYSRIDGKCNNPTHNNLGSSFHCHRRLLPPDYSDGIYDPRVGFDQRPLPSPRLITQLLMPDLDVIDFQLNAMHIFWGQMLVHDTFRTIQYFGLAIACCYLINPPEPYPPHIPPDMLQNRAVLRDSPPVLHPECQPIVNFPANLYTEMYNQRCVNFVRSTNCNTCSLGKNTTKYSKFLYHKIL